MRSQLAHCWRSALFGLDTSKLKPTGYVNDFAHVLDAAGQAASRSLLRAIWNGSQACRWRSCWSIRSKAIRSKTSQPSVSRMGHRQERQRRRHSAVVRGEGPQETAPKSATVWSRSLPMATRAECCAASGRFCGREITAGAMLAAAQQFGQQDRARKGCRFWRRSRPVRTSGDPQRRTAFRGRC